MIIERGGRLKLFAIFCSLLAMIFNLVIAIYAPAVKAELQDKRPVNAVQIAFSTCAVLLFILAIVAIVNDYPNIQVTVVVLLYFICGAFVATGLVSYWPSVIDDLINTNFRKLNAAERDDLRETASSFTVLLWTNFVISVFGNSLSYYILKREYCPTVSCVMC